MAHEIRTVAYNGHVADNPNTFTYSGSFDVFKGLEVKVTLDNVVLTYTATTINDSASPREYSVDTTAKTIHIGGANLTSGSVQIIPTTDLGQLPGSTAPQAKADYTPGSSITSEDLNNNQLQLMRRALEYDEQKLDTSGGTMTGNLHFGKDIDLSFEGSTDNAYETTITVADPTADRTITFPNVSGNVVTTGDTATITATMLAADSVDSSELVNGSVDNSHLADDAVDSDELASGAVDLDHMSANSVGEHQYVDASIKTAHIANDQIDSQHYAAGSIDLEHMSADSIDSAQYVDGSIDLAHMSVNSVSTDQYVDNSIQHVHLQNDIIDGDNIQDDVINSEHIAAGAIDLEHMSSASVDSDNIVDGTIVNADISTSAAIDHSKLAAVSSGNVLVGNGSNQAASVAMSGDVAIAAGGATTIQANSVEIGMIGCEQTTISDSDSHIPTSGAVVDYVAAQIAPLGGLEVIADDESFPNTIAPAGVVISITDAAGLPVNSSGVSTNADALDNSTITINGFPSELRGGVGSNADPYVFGAGAGLMVKSTGSSQTYDYHQALIREADFVNLSDDINDFNNRYRIGTKTANNSDTNHDGDLFFDTGTNKMYVYDGAYDASGEWKEVTSAGDYKLLTLKDNGQAHDGNLNLNGSNDQFDLFDGTSDASITSAGQLIVVLNGVVQKPNASYDASGEGFALDGSDGIRFCDPPPNGSVCFVTQIGTATTVNVPADNSVSEAKIQVGAVSHTRLAADCVDGDNIQDDVINSEHIAAGAVDLEHMSSQSVDEDNLHISNAGTNGQFLQKSSNSGGLTWADAGVTSDAQNNTVAGGNAGDAFDGTEANNNTLIGYDAGTGITQGDLNVAIGMSANVTGTTGGENTAVGAAALRYSGPSATSNTAIGTSALHSSVSGSTGELTGSYNTAVGANSLFANTSGQYNSALGNTALDANTSGDYNCAFGANALGANVGGDNNTAVGVEALLSSTASNNTALGMQALDSCTTGGSNTAVGRTALGGVTGTGEHTAVGYYALAGNTSGERNIGIGCEAGITNTSGSDQVFLGWKAGNTNNGNENIFIGASSALYMDTGAGNVALGYKALRCASGSTTHPDNNVAIGNGSMHSATEANENTAVGGDTLYDVTTGSENCAFGRFALANVLAGGRNVASGYNAGLNIDTGGNNVCMGFAAGAHITSGDNNVCIGLNAAVDQVTTSDNELWIARSNDNKGNDPVWIYGNHYGEIINGNNGTAFAQTSDVRLKKNITDSPKGLAEIDQLRIRNFEYKEESEIDMSQFPSADGPHQVVLCKSKKGQVQTGIIAQEVESVLPECIKQDKHGAKTVDSEPMMWALINAVKELSAKVKALEAK